MRRRTRHFKVGLFVLVCLGLAAGGLVWIGASRVLRESRTYVAFFDESVEGLDENAKVSYRGVRVGHVSSIDLAPDDRLVRVRMDLVPEFEVDDSLAVVVASEGLTGRRYLEIDLAPPDIEAKTPRIDFPTEDPVIRSRPSTFTRVERGLADIVEKVGRADLDGLVAEWKSAGRELHDLLGDPAIRQLVSDLQAATAGLEEALAPLRDPAFAHEFWGSAEDLLANWNRVARDLDALIADPAFPRTLENLELASQDLRQVLAAFEGGEDGRSWESAVDDLSATAAASRRASEALAAQIEGLPPGVAGRIAERVDHAAGSVETSFSKWGEQGDRILLSLESSVRRVDQLVAQLDALVRNLRENPGRILSRPGHAEPFEER